MHAREFDRDLDFDRHDPVELGRALRLGRRRGALRRAAHRAGDEAPHEGVREPHEDAPDGAPGDLEAEGADREGHAGVEVRADAPARGELVEAEARRNPDRPARLQRVDELLGDPHADGEFDGGDRAGPVLRERVEASLPEEGPDEAGDQAAFDGEDEGFGGAFVNEGSPDCSVGVGFALEELLQCDGTHPAHEDGRLHGRTRRELRAQATRRTDEHLLDDRGNETRVTFEGGDHAAAYCTTNWVK